jgi:hypothetical protein
VDFTMTGNMTDNTNDDMTENTNKRWDEPGTIRAALYYVLVFVALAVAAFAAAVAWRSLIAGILVPVILFAGGIGAFVRTYQEWRREGVWVIWQGAGWILLLMFLFCLGVPAGVWWQSP